MFKNLYNKTISVLEFLGLTILSFSRFFTGKARYRKKDLLLVFYESGPASIGIVCLISLLVGLILAYIGSIQLEQFGAVIYIADLVGLAMLREMGAIMTSIIMAGRTGASFAASIATMEANEEIDALKTTGISPIDFLVVPRVISFIICFPFLCIVSDLVGILGGAIVGVSSFEISPIRYFEQTILRVDLTDFFIGLIKSIFFGIIVSLSACYFGIKSKRTAEGVGNATTSSVVVSIVLIIICDAIFAVLTSVLGI